MKLKFTVKLFTHDDVVGVSQANVDCRIVAVDPLILQVLMPL